MLWGLRVRIFVAISISIFLCLSEVNLCAATQEFWMAADVSPSVVLDLYSGQVPVTISSATVSSRLSVLVHLSSLTPEQWDVIQGRIRNLINATRQSGGIDLYYWRHGGAR